LLGGARVIETTEALHVLLRHGPRYDIFRIRRIDAEAPADRDLRLLRVAHGFYTQVQPRWRKHNFTTDGGRLCIGGLHPQVGGKRRKGILWTGAGKIFDEWTFSNAPPAFVPATKAPGAALRQQDLVQVIRVVSVKSPLIFTTSRGAFLIRPLADQYELLEKDKRGSARGMSFIGPGRVVRVVRSRHGCLEVASGQAAGRTVWTDLGQLMGVAPAADATIVQPEQGTKGGDSPESLDWIVLHGDWVSKRFGSGRRESVLPASTTPRNKMSIERIRFLESLKPARMYEGSHLGNVVYYVALFPRVVIADCVDEGNAIYYLPERSPQSWKAVFRLSKQEARRAGARRIVHSGEWKSRVRDLLRR
jgi:hypothetical protein